MMPRLFWAGLFISCCVITGPRLAAAQTAAPSASSASEPWYAVEVLVFRSLRPADARQETWPAKVPAPSLAQALFADDTAAGAYSALSGHGSLIANAALHLQRSGHYAVIKTLGWKQPDTSARPVSFAPIPETSASATALPATTRAYNHPAVGLQGSARLLSAGDRTYVVLDLRLCQPSPRGIVVQTPLATTIASPLAATAGTPEANTRPHAPLSRPGEQCFALDQRHRVRSGKLTYYDNPAFGALVSVRSIKPPKNPTTPP